MNSQLVGGRNLFSWEINLDHFSIAFALSTSTIAGWSCPRKTWVVLSRADHPSTICDFSQLCMSCQFWVEIKNNNNISSGPSASPIPTVGIIIITSTKKKKFLICFFAPSSFLFNRSCALYERPKCRVSHKKGVVAAGFLALLARPGRSTLAHYFSVLFS